MFLKEGQSLEINLIPDLSQLDGMSVRLKSNHLHGNSNEVIGLTSVHSSEMSDRLYSRPLKYTLIDSSIKDTRLVLTLLMYNVSSKDSKKGNALFEVTFHSGKEYYFTHADLRFEFNIPKDIYISKIAPIHQQQYGKMLKLRKFGLGFQLASLGVNFEKDEVLFNSIKGSGQGTKIIDWTFEAHKDNKEGLPHHTLLFMTVPSDVDIKGLLSGTFTVSDGKSWLRFITNTHERKIKSPLSFSILSKDNNEEKKSYLDNFTLI